MSTLLTYQDFYDQMGLVNKSLMNPQAGTTYTQKAWVHMGLRMHGDSLTPSWIAAIPGGNGNAYYNDITNTAWEDVSGWFHCQPAADNTCTNALIRIKDFQTQYFDLTENEWKLISADAYKYRVPGNLSYFTTDAYNSDGTADKVYVGISNHAMACNIKVAGDRVAPMLTSETSKVRIIHNGITRAPLDYTKVGGIAVMCKAKVVPISGSLNGVSSVMLSVGADYYPRSGINANQAGTILDGITSLPSVGGSAMKQLTETEQTFVFATVKINSDTYVYSDSAYSVANSGIPNVQCMDSSLFAANVPQFITF